MTLTSLSIAVSRTTSASPWPYVDLSCDTNSAVGASSWTTYCAAKVPCEVSFPQPRYQNVQPFSARPGFVADCVTNGIPFSSNVSPAASDSPENAGPNTATVFGSLTTSSTTGGALSPDPCVSPCARVMVAGYPSS